MDDATQAQTVINMLNAKTGVTWRYHMGRGNVVATRLPVLAQSLCTVNSSIGRNAAH